ncbi:MAG: hypothetical protein AB2L14_37890 [Candidatus Xenobiia bacterium LiM19]
MDADFSGRSFARNGSHNGGVNSMDVLERMLMKEREALGSEVIAPVIRKKKVLIRVREQVYECHLDREFSGWGIFEMHDRGRARLVREAEIWEKERYAGAFHARSLVLFFRDSAGIWWARDAGRQEFVKVYLVEGEQQFDTVRSSFDGTQHWYISPGNVPDIQKAQKLREALTDGIPADKLHFIVSSLSRLDLELYSLALKVQKSITELDSDAAIKRIERALHLGCAEMLGATEQGDGYLVQWKRGSETHRSYIDRDLNVVSAGFCLSGGDRLQDLTTLASLIKQRGTQGGR